MKQRGKQGMFKSMSALALVVVMVLSSVVMISGETRVTSPGNTPESRRAYIRQVLDDKIGYNTLHFDVGLNRSFDYTRYGGLTSSPRVMDVINADLDFYRRLAAEVFPDVRGDEFYGHLIPLGIYSGMINGYEDGTFRGEQAVTIAEFSWMMGVSAHEPDRIELVATQNRHGGHSLGWHTHWWVAGMVLMQSYMPSTWGFVEPEHAAIAAAYPSHFMSRGDVAYAIAKNSFGDELEEMIVLIGGDLWGRVSGGFIPADAFVDANRINPKTTRVNRVNARDNPTFTDFALLRECIDNPSDGIPVEYLAAITILRSKGIMAGVGNNMSGWYQPVTRGQTLAFLANMAKYRMENY